VAEERQPRIGLRIGLDGHAHVAIPAARREQLRGRRREAEQLAALHVHDDVGGRQALQDGAEGRRVVAAAENRGADPRVGGAQERRGRIGERRRGAGEQDDGDGDHAPREGQTKDVRHAWF
jgi:hypothetical protein